MCGMQRSFFFNDTATTEIYTLSLHDALPISARVDFVVLGGIAVVMHGHVRATLDLDVCYARTSDNLERLARALAPLEAARLSRRGVTPGVHAPPASPVQTGDCTEN